MPPPWVKWFLNKELVAVSQWTRWATCLPTTAFNSSIYKLNPGHKWEGLKKFYPNTTGLSKGSKLALQLVWFPFFAPFWKVGFHFAFLYRALSCSIPVLLRVGSCLALARSRAQLTHHDTYLEGGRGCLVPKWRSLSGSLQGQLRLPAYLTFWEVQFSPEILVCTGLFLKLFFFLMWTIFKVLIEFVTILLLFYILVLGHKVCGIFAPWAGIKPTPLALEGKVMTTGLPGKSYVVWLLDSCLLSHSFHGSWVQVWLRWVLSSGRHKATI